MAGQGQTCSNREGLNATKIVDCDGKGQTVQCPNNGMAPLSPRILTCGKLGSYNLDNQYRWPNNIICGGRYCMCVCIVPDRITLSLSLAGCLTLAGCLLACLCYCLFMSTYLFYCVFTSACLSVLLSVHVYLSICFTVCSHLPVCLCYCLFMSTYLFYCVFTSACLSVLLSVHVYLSVLLCVHICLSVTCCWP